MKATEERRPGGLSVEDVFESIVDTNAIKKVLRSRSVERVAARERLDAIELTLDERRQAATVGARSDLRAQVLEVLADDPMEDGALHGPRLVAGGTHTRRRSERRAGRPGDASDPAREGVTARYEACNTMLRAQIAFPSSQRCAERRPIPTSLRDADRAPCPRVAIHRGRTASPVPGVSALLVRLVEEGAARRGAERDAERSAAAAGLAADEADTTGTALRTICARLESTSRGCARGCALGRLVTQAITACGPAWGEALTGAFRNTLAGCWATHLARRAADEAGRGATDPTDIPFAPIARLQARTLSGA